MRPISFFLHLNFWPNTKQKYKPEIKNSVRIVPRTPPHSHSSGMKESR